MVRALVPAHFLEALEAGAQALGVELVPCDHHGTPRADSQGAEVLFRWWISAAECDQLIRAHPLRWIHSGSAGVDHILTPLFLASNAILTNAAGVHAAPIAEWVVAAMLSAEKDIPGMIERQRQRIWDKVMRDELSRKTVVVLGAGAIAGAIAARLRPFEVRLRAIRRSRGLPPGFDEVRTTGEIADSVADADWLIVAAPLTAQTRGLVNSTVLSRMSPRSRIVNVARGEIIVESALISALDEGRIAGAVLDVFDTEPLPDDHPFWRMPNVLVLPHTTWRSPLIHRRQAALFLDNLGRWVRGEPLRNLVDVSAGY